MLAVKETSGAKRMPSDPTLSYAFSTHLPRSCSASFEPASASRCAACSCCSIFEACWIKEATRSCSFLFSDPKAAHLWGQCVSLRGLRGFEDRLNPAQAVPGGTFAMCLQRPLGATLIGWFGAGQAIEARALLLSC